MTEREIIKKIDDSENKIYYTYTNLRSAVQEVGDKSLKAAQEERTKAVSGASGSKARNTLLPL